MLNWKLKDSETGEEIAIGSERYTSNAELVRVESIEAPRSPASSGRVYVSFLSGIPTGTHGYYPSVINAELVPIYSRAVEWKDKRYTLAYDEYNVLDTITLHGDKGDKLMLNTSNAGRFFLKHAEAIRAGFLPEGVK